MCPKVHPVLFPGPMLQLTQILHGHLFALRRGDQAHYGDEGQPITKQDHVPTKEDIEMTGNGRTHNLRYHVLLGGARDSLLRNEAFLWAGA